MSLNDGDILDRLARLLEYPDGDYRRRVREAVDWLCAEGSEAAALLDQFADRVEGMAMEDLQELFVHSFDINPVCCLEVGWHIHGDNYDRGDFLVRMRRYLREMQIPESNELPDHLAHVLPVLARLEGEEARELVDRYAVPAMDRMVEGLAGKDCPFEHLIRAIRGVVISKAVPAA